MANPSPNLENLIPRTRCDRTIKPLAVSPIMVRLFADVDTVVRSLPNRSAWLRRVITEAAQRELMKDGES
jgi:hypothetical protein